MKYKYVVQCVPHNLGYMTEKGLTTQDIKKAKQFATERLASGYAVHTWGMDVFSIVVISTTER